MAHPRFAAPCACDLLRCAMTLLVLLIVLAWRPGQADAQSGADGLWLAPGSVSVGNAKDLQLSFRTRTLLWTAALRLRSNPGDRLVVACGPADLPNGAAAMAYLIRLGVNRSELSLVAGGAMAPAGGALRVLRIPPAV